MPVVKIFGKKVEYRPYVSKMYLPKLKARLELNPSFIKVFKVDLTDDFFEEHRDIVNPDKHFVQNAVWVVSGGTGTGKSIVAYSLCKHLVPERFTHENICFFDSQILELAPQVPQNTFIVRDEGVGKAVFGVGSTRQRESLSVLIETCRKYGLSVVFIEPEERELDVAKYYLETIDMDMDRRVTRVAVKDAITKTYLGAIYVPVVPEDDEGWVAYNEKKDEFIEMMRRGEYRDSKVDYRALAIEFAARIDTEQFRTKGERRVYLQAELPNYTNAEVKIIQTFMEIVLRDGEDAIYER